MQPPGSEEPGVIVASRSSFFCSCKILISSGAQPECDIFSKVRIHFPSDKIEIVLDKSSDNPYYSRSTCLFVQKKTQETLQNFFYKVSCDYTIGVSVTISEFASSTLTHFTQKQ